MCTYLNCVESKLAVLEFTLAKSKYPQQTNRAPCVEIRGYRGNYRTMMKNEGGMGWCLGGKTDVLGDFFLKCHAFSSVMKSPHCPRFQREMQGYAVCQWLAGICVLIHVSLPQRAGAYMPDRETACGHVQHMWQWQEVHFLYAVVFRSGWLRWIIQQ